MNVREGTDHLVAAVRRLAENACPLDGVAELQTPLNYHVKPDGTELRVACSCAAAVHQFHIDPEGVAVLS